MWTGLLRRLVMASAASGLYLTKVRRYSYLTDFLQGKYTHACNCKQDFQQTGSLSGQKITEAKKAFYQKVIPGNPRPKEERQNITYSTVHNPWHLLCRIYQMRSKLCLINTVVFKTWNKTVLEIITTTTTKNTLWNLGREWEWEEILNQKKHNASIFLILPVRAISLATYVSVN